MGYLSGSPARGAGLAAALAAFGFALAAAPAGARAPELRLPAQAAGFSRGQTVDFERVSPGGGYAVNYTKPGWRADLYVYDKGRSDISNGPSSGVVRAELDEAFDAVRQVAGRSSIDATETGSFQAPRSGKTRFACKSLALEVPGRPSLKSVLCLTGYRNSFLKLRLTGSGSEDARAEADRLLASLLKQL